MSFDDFVITSFVSGSGSSTLPIVVYGMVRKNVEPSINAISTIILVVTAAHLPGRPADSGRAGEVGSAKTTKGWSLARETRTG